jgi:hypothetical protein
VQRQSSATRVRAQKACRLPDPALARGTEIHAVQPDPTRAISLEVRALRITPQLMGSVPAITRLIRLDIMAPISSSLSRRFLWDSTWNGICSVSRKLNRFAVDFAEKGTWSRSTPASHVLITLHGEVWDRRVNLPQSPSVAPPQRSLDSIRSSRSRRTEVGTRFGLLQQTKHLAGEGGGRHEGSAKQSTVPPTTSEPRPTRGL